MIVLIASNSPTTSVKLRKALAALGQECPITHVVGLDQIVATVQTLSKPADLVFLVMPEDETPSRDALRHLRPQTSARIVVVGSARSSRSVLEALHAGADDYVDDNLDLLEQVRMTIGRLAATKDAALSGQLLIVTSACGGSACSTVAANVAVLLARRDGVCGLLDLASGFGDLASLLNLNPRYTLVDLLRNHESFDGGMFNQSLTEHSSGVKLLATSNQYDDVEAVTPQLLSRVATVSRSQFAWTVADVDCRTRRNHELLRQAHRIVLTVRLDFASLCNTRRLLDSWKQNQIDSDRVFLVASASGQVGEVPEQDAQKLLAQKFAGRLPCDPVAANLSANCGIPMVLESPKSPPTKAIHDIVEAICGPANPDSQARSRRARSAPDAGLLKRVAGVLF